jgi:hypothetical protein
MSRGVAVKAGKEGGVEVQVESFFSVVAVIEFGESSIVGWGMRYRSQMQPVVLDTCLLEESDIEDSGGDRA